MAESYIQIVGNWTAFPGYLHGLPMPFMIGFLRVELPEKFDCTILDERLGNYTATELPFDVARKKLGKKALITRLLFWSASILRLNKIAVTHAFNLSIDPQHPFQVKVFIPYRSAQASATTIQLLSQCYNESIDSMVRSVENIDFNQLVTDALNKIEQAVKANAEPGQNQTFFLQIAQTMRIPCREIVRGVHVFGTGKYGLVLNSSLTTHTSNIAVQCARDKGITSKILRDAGLPGADHVLVSSVEEAIHAAKKIGYPVVVKPADLDGGLGVYSNIVDEPMLVKMVEQSRKFSLRTLVEKHFFGNGHRLTIQNGRLVFATRKLAAGVEGDGVSTIEELVIAEQGEREAKRSATSAHQNPLELDEEAMDLLAQYNLHPESIPEKCDYIILRRKNNAIAGGTSISLKEEEIHPDNLQLCIYAAEVMHLDIAGIDLLIPDIGVSWKESGSLICEVNAQPQIGYSAAEIMMRRFFANGSRIPACLIMNCTQQLAIHDAFILRWAMKLGCNSASYKSGTWIDGVKLPAQFNRAFDAAQHVLFYRKTNSALCAVDFDEFKQTGLPLDYFNRIILIHDDASGDLIKVVSELVKAHTKEIELVSLVLFEN
ncbi:MAG: hypothetical protein H8M99_08415 [Gloeobacteraceae cyanobacterium ES-bin-144]|nr:hypothetical protein [Verrucomicrobiales bacterium]